MTPGFTINGGNQVSCGASSVCYLNNNTVQILPDGCEVLRVLMLFLKACNPDNASSGSTELGCACSAAMTSSKAMGLKE